MPTVNSDIATTALFFIANYFAFASVVGFVKLLNPLILSEFESSKPSKMKKNDMCQHC